MGGVMNVPGTDSRVTTGRNSAKPCQYWRVPVVTYVLSLCARVRDTLIHAHAHINKYSPRVHVRNIGNTEYTPCGTTVLAVPTSGNTGLCTRNIVVASAFSPVYASPCLKTTGNGLGSPVSKGAQRRNSVRKAAFLCAALRAAFGAECINDIIRAGIDGQPVFHASENGHSVGTPLPYDARQAISLADVSIGPWNRASAPQNATSKGKK